MDIDECKPFDRVVIFSAPCKKSHWRGRVGIIDSVDYPSNTIMICWGGDAIRLDPTDVEKYQERIGNLR